MIQGDTWPHKIVIPFSTDKLKAMQVVYVQAGTILYRKTLADSVLSGNKVQLTLSQRETLELSPKKDLEIQARFLTNDNVALNTEVFLVTVDPSYIREVLE